MSVPKRERLAGVSPASQANIKGGERQMSYLIQVANQRPMLRISAEVLLSFCCAAPLVLALAYGVNSLLH
jgi:hypothetical protein